MSTIFRDSQGQPIKTKDLPGCMEKCRCSVCDGPSDAWWGAAGIICVCYQCALDALPALIADAMCAKGTSTDLLTRTKERMDIRFWMAAALALSRDPEDAASTSKQATHSSAR